MKENKLIEMWNRVEILGANTQAIIKELQNLKDLSIGTLETLKRVPGYEKALEDMKTVSPRIFLREKDCENTLVIDISPAQTEISRQLLPISRHIPVSANPGEWVRKLSRIITDHKNQSFLSVVVFNETGDGYSSVSKILAGADIN